MDQEKTEVKDDREDKLACALAKRIKSALECKKREDWVRRIEKNRRYVEGKIHDDDSGKLVRANIIYSTIQTILPRVYSKNPEIVAKPSEAVGDTRYSGLKLFARTLTVVLNRQLSEAGLKKRAKSSVRSTMTTGLAWVKVTYQRDFGKDPIIQQRIADIQDNIAKIDALLEELKESDSVDEHELTRQQLAEMVAALEEKAEVVVAEGLVIERMQAEDIVILDDLRDTDDYVNARAIAQRIWYTPEKYEETFGEEPPPKASSYSKSRTKDAGSTDEDKLIPVYEVWDREMTRVFTVSEDADRFSRDPFTPRVIGERFYPFFMLVFNQVDGSFYPLSDVELLEELADEYNANRTQLAEHRGLLKPHWIAASDTDDKSIKRFTHADLGEVVLIDTNGRPLRDVFDVPKMPEINPALYDTSPIRADIEMVSGAGDAARANLVTAKTATEAEILEAGLASRTDERKDTIEDWIQSIAQYSAEILLQELTGAQVQRIAGPEAVWPELTKDEIFDLVEIEIRAGTSGKPNKVREQRQWLEFLPEMQKLVLTVSDLRDKGRDEEAEVLVKIMRETLRRFDERIDVEEFLPERKKDDPQEILRAQEKQAAMEQRQRATNIDLDKGEADVQRTRAETLSKLMQSTQSGTQPPATMIQ